MDARKLPNRPNFRVFENLAKDLFNAYQSADPPAMKRLHEHYGQKLTHDEMRQAIQQQLSRLKKPENRTEKFRLSDAQLLIAGSYGFESWRSLKKHVDELHDKTSAVAKFEAAADAVISGNITKLKRLLRETPALIRARSKRIHKSTLLHYVSANGVEDFRQKTPSNIVEVTKLLLEAGAEVDAENNPGRGTTLGLVATSYHPAAAGVQLALLDRLIEAGASPNGLSGGWKPVEAALANGRGDAAKFLAERGARLNLEEAAGVGRLDIVRRFFREDGKLKSTATKKQLMSGFAWACQFGNADVVDFMLEHGVDLEAKLRHNGETGLHWAAYNAHVETVKMLLERKASVNAKDESFDGTPLDWAIYSWGSPPPEAERDRFYEVVEVLVAVGGTVDQDWLNDSSREMPLVEKIRSDPRMLAALGGQIR